MSCMACGGAIVYIAAFGPGMFCTECQYHLDQVLAQLRYSEKVREAAQFAMDVQTEVDKRKGLR